ncbi:hypothetical protein MRX96_034750 [Rhipicephalus microplus]
MPLSTTATPPNDRLRSVHTWPIKSCTSSPGGCEGLAAFAGVGSLATSRGGIGWSRVGVFRGTEPRATSSHGVSGCFVVGSPPNVTSRCKANASDVGVFAGVTLAEASHDRPCGADLGVFAGVTLAEASRERPSGADAGVFTGVTLAEVSHDRPCGADLGVFAGVTLAETSRERPNGTDVGVFAGVTLAEASRDRPCGADVGAFAFASSGVLVSADDVDDFDEVEDPRLVPAPRERGADADVEGAIFESSLDSGMLQQRRTAGATRERLETQGVVRKRKRLGQPEPLDHHFFF